MFDLPRIAAALSPTVGIEMKRAAGLLILLSLWWRRRIWGRCRSLNGESAGTAKTGIGQQRHCAFGTIHQTTTPLALRTMTSAASRASAAKSRNVTSALDTTKFSFQESTTERQQSPTNTSGRFASTPVCSLFQTSETSVTVPIPPLNATKPTDRVIKF